MENPSFPVVLKTGEKHKESIAATLDVEKVYNLIKIVPETDDYGSDNTPLEVAKNLYALESIKQEPDPIVSSSNKVMKQRRNLIDELNQLSNSTSNDSMEQALVKIETTEAIYGFEEVDVQEWMIKKEELNIEEDLERNETSFSPDCVGQDVQEKSGRYTPKKKNYLKTHRLKHNNSEEVQQFICAHCSFKTIYKWVLKSHLIVHRNPEEVEMFKCNQCDFQTGHKKYLKTHRLRHDNPEDVQQFTCDQCSFKTIYKSHLTRHLILHRNPEEAQMFKCDKCDFQTKFKHNVKIHQQRHDNPAEVEQFTCDQCSFKTINKRSLKKHQIIHRNPEEVEMFKCNQCDFQTKHKHYLKRHQLAHSNSEFKCDQCSYKAICKSHLKRHLISHQNPGGNV